MTRMVKTQLIVFAIVGILAMIYVGINYARLPRLSGVAEYPVTVQMPDSGGLFPNAEVTYQGVPVGRVASMQLTDQGVNANLKLSKSAPKVPATATAVVASRSAIGEQFIDLISPGESQAYFASGDTITISGNRRTPARYRASGNGAS